MSRLTCALFLLSLVFAFSEAINIITPTTLHRNLKQSFDEERYLKHLEMIGVSIPRAHFFTQKLDHFDHQNTNTWQQRYFVNDTYWTPGGPIFLQIGGEGAISPLYVLTMEYVEYAKTYGALIVAVEHRFYGKSAPLPDLTTPNLRYLTSQQALADVAYFIQNFKQTTKGAQDSQFVTFGCSYPGALAAWFRGLYPFHTSGSISSSGPVQATLDFYEYLQVVDQSLSFFTGAQCDNRIQAATDQIQSMLGTPSGQASLQQMFKTCSPPNNSADISTFMSDLMGNWMGTVQYNDEQTGNPIDINYLCGIMNNQSMTPLQAYVQVSDLFLGQNGQSCLDISYAAMIQELRQVDQTSHGVGIRQWTYQTCFEFGYFQTTDAPNQPFGDLVPLNYWLQMCKDVFSDNGTYVVAPGEHVNETNILYGGNQAHGTTRIMYVNGSVDPWHSLSVTTPLNAQNPTILIEGTAHCADANPPNSLSPPTLAQAQAQISAQIGVWLQAGNP